MARLTDKVFFKAPIDYQEVLRKLSEKLSVEVELGPLLQDVPLTMTQDLKLKHVEILTADKEGNLCRRDHASGRFIECVPKDHDFVQYLSSSTDHIIERDALERKIEDTKDGMRADLETTMHEMERFDAMLISPITSQNTLTGVLVLGQKLAGDTFNIEEQRLLKVLGPQIGSALEKAKLFEEVRTFSHKLEIEVERATRELKERNQFLLALQNVTSLITHSLDYKKVTQQIVDGVANELGYVGGILILVDPKTKETHAEAITETTITRAAMKLLPKAFNQFHGSFDDGSKTANAMRTGTVERGDKLSDFLHPALPTVLCDTVQRLTRIKHVIAVPIYSEETVVGALVVGIGKPGSTVSLTEVTMMKSLADQAGIVMRNLSLFEQIQATNKELGTANKHLKTLDEAKSEFISIASHQLRTPMTGIMGYLSMLVGGDYGKFKPDVSAILVTILTASKRMIRLINIFLNISKIEAGKFEINKKPTHIENIIDTEFIELSKLAKDKKLKLKYARPIIALPEVMIDRDKIADVTQNLIDNAIKYTEKGSVTVKTEIRGGELIVSVKDTGRGIKKEEVGKLFNKFVRGDGIARIQPDGSGLGLFIAKKIVEAHGGRIWVESEGEGKGSTFAFAVPVKK